MATSSTFQHWRSSSTNGRRPGRLRRLLAADREREKPRVTLAGQNGNQGYNITLKPEPTPEPPSKRLNGPSAEHNGGRSQEPRDGDGIGPWTIVEYLEMDSAFTQRLEAAFAAGSEVRESASRNWK